MMSSSTIWFAASKRWQTGSCRISAMHKITVRAGSNIAFIKYWGVADPSINLPLTSSVSMTLAAAHTTTTVEWLPAAEMPADAITVDGAALTGGALVRVERHLDRIRTLAGVACRARVASRNNFPMASGIASSASGFAALTVAACRAADLDLDPTRLSALARLGSGSASRSLFGGFVMWERGHNDASSIAHSLYPPDHWDLVDVVAVVSSTPKQVSSEGGHRLAATSPLNDARVAHANRLLPEVVDAIQGRSLDRLGPLIEMDALAMHAVMMTSSPNLLYWQPGTVEIIQAVQRWRFEDGLPAYFTIDAGPNVHVICESSHAAEVTRRLDALPSVRRTLASGPGPDPAEIAGHLI